MSSESYKTILEIIGIALLGLTFIDGGLVWYFSRLVNKEQAEKIRELDSALTEAKKENLELERALTLRRLIVRMDTSKNVSNIDTLKPFAEVNVILEFLPDIEASRAASDISGVLNKVGWNVVEFTASPELNKELFDGVTVIEPLTSGANKNLVDVKTRAAANEFIGLLKANDWDVKSLPAKASAETPGKPGYIAPNTIKISVGFKPSPYSLPKDIREAIEKMRQDFIHRSQPLPK